MSAPNRRRAIPVRKEGVPRALGLPGGVRHCTRHLAGACAAQCARAAGAAAPAAEDAQWSRAALTPPTSSGPETNGPISACWSSPGPLSMATLDRDTLPRLQLVKLRPTWYRFPHNGLRSHGNGTAFPVYQYLNNAYFPYWIQRTLYPLYATYCTEPAFISEHSERPRMDELVSGFSGLLGVNAWSVAPAPHAGGAAHGERSPRPQAGERTPRRPGHAASPSSAQPGLSGPRACKC